MADADELQLMNDVLSRWTQAVDLFRQDQGVDVPLTYRSVLSEAQSAGGGPLFGERVGGIGGAASAVQVLLSALYGHYPDDNRWAFVNDFASLCLCDLAVDTVDDELYRDLARRLRRQNCADFQARVRQRLGAQRVFPVGTAQNQARLYVLSLCAFVPAARVSTDLLHRLLNEATAELEPRWEKSGVGPRDRGPRLREWAADFLARRYRGKSSDALLDPFVLLLQGFRRVYDFARGLGDFGAMSLDEFAAAYARVYGWRPMGDQPLPLTPVLWDHLRGLLGAVGAVVRVSPQALLRMARQGRVAALPDESAVPLGFAALPEDRVPWGRYRTTDGRAVLVASVPALAGISDGLLDQLLALPLPTLAAGAAARWEGDGADWLVAAWPFRVFQGPASSPLRGLVDGAPRERHVCLDVPRPVHVIYRTDAEASAPPVRLTGRGESAPSRPAASWRLVDAPGQEGLRLRLVVFMPQNEREGTVLVRRGGVDLGTLNVLFDDAFSAPLDVPPQGEVELVGGDTGKLIARIARPFRGPMLFLPPPRFGQYWGINEGHEMPFHHRRLLLVADAGCDLSPSQGFAIEPEARDLGPGWEALALRVLRREGNYQTVRIEARTAAGPRVLWQSERRLGLLLCADGADPMAGGGFAYGDPAAVILRVRGYLGRLADATAAAASGTAPPTPAAPDEAWDNAPVLHVIDGERQVRLVVAGVDRECDWSRDLSTILKLLPPAQGCARHLRLYLETPDGIPRTGEAALDLWSRPRLPAASRPVIRPGETSFTVRVQCPGAVTLDYGDHGSGAWRRVVASNGTADLTLTVTDAILRDGRATAPVRIEGVVFDAAVDVTVSVVGLVVADEAGRRLMTSASDRTPLRLHYEPDTILQASGLVEGERLDINAAGTADGPPLASLGATDEAVPLARLGLRRRVNPLVVTLRGPDCAGQVVSRFEVTRRAELERVDTMQRGDRIEVVACGFVPEDEEPDAILSALPPAGTAGQAAAQAWEVLDETALSHAVGQGGIGPHAATLALPPGRFIATELLRVTIRLEGGETSYGVTSDGGGAAPDPPGLAEYRANAEAAWAGRPLPPPAAAEPMALIEALRRWAANPADAVARDAYLELLLGDPPADLWRPVMRRELQRVVEHWNASFRSSSLNWDRAGRDAAVMERLLGWLQASPPSDRASARVALVAALAACRADADYRYNTALRPLGLRQFSSWRVLAEIRPDENLFPPLAPKDLVDALMNAAPGKSADAWQRLADFFRRTGWRFNLERVATELWRRAADSPLASMLALSLVAARPLEASVVEEPTGASTADVPTWADLLRAAARADPATTGACRAALSRGQRPRPGETPAAGRAREAATLSALADTFAALRAEPPGVAPAVAAYACQECTRRADDPRRAMIGGALKTFSPFQRREVLRQALDLIAAADRAGDLAGQVGRCLDLFLDETGAATNVPRWLEFLGGTDLCLDESVPVWAAPMLDHLARQERVEGDPLLLAQTLPELVRQLEGSESTGRVGSDQTDRRAVRQGLARLLGCLFLPLLDRSTPEFPADWSADLRDRIADACARLFIGDNLGRRNPFASCLDFYDSPQKRYEKPANKQDAEYCDGLLPALALLVATQRSRDATAAAAGRRDLALFNLASSAHKLLGRYYLGLMASPAVAMSRKRSYAATGAGVYLGYLRLDRWDPKELEVWQKIHQCARAMAGRDLVALQVDCGRFRAREGFLGAADWWLQRAAASVKDVGSNGPTDVAADLTRAGNELRRAREEECESPPAERRVRALRRMLRIRVLANGDAEFRPADANAMREAVSCATAGQDLEELMGGLMSLPGIPPQAVVTGTRPSIVSLLEKGVRGLPRQQIVAWMVFGRPGIADALGLEYLPLPEDLKKELAEDRAADLGEPDPRHYSGDPHAPDPSRQ